MSAPLMSFAFYTPPGVISETRLKVSPATGFNSTDVVWSYSLDAQAWQFRVVTDASQPVTSGTQIVAATVSIPANTQTTTTITEAAVAAASPADGPKVVKLFVQDTGGNWSA